MPDTGLVRKLLRQHPGYFQRMLDHPDSFRIQILYTQINRDKNNKPSFREFTYNLNNNQYFYPASTVKMPVVFLVLEKLNELNSTFQQLSGTENLLNKTQEDLTLKALREKKLQGQYTDVEKKKNALDEENSDLKKDLQSTRKKLDDTLIELDTAKNDLKSRNDKIDNLEEDIADLKKEVSCLRAGNADC